MNVMIVDDSKVVRHILKTTISEYFHTAKWGRLRIFEAEDGIEAMRNIKEYKVDIIFLDINMPNMNGREVVGAIRSNEDYKDVRIIMATTENTKDDVLKLIKNGVNAYMVKPFNEELIIKTLDSVTGRMKQS